MPNQQRQSTEGYSNTLHVMYFPERGCVRPLRGRHLYGYATGETVYNLDYRVVSVVIAGGRAAVRQRGE